MQNRVKTAQEIAAMVEGGKMLASVHQHIRTFVKAGVSGKDVSALARRELKAFGATATFEGYHGFPDVICVSVNDEVVHGIPNAIPFAAGDLVSFDFGVTYRGLVTDGAFSMFIGKVPTKEVEALLEATDRSLRAGISVLKDGAYVGDISAAVQEVLDAGDYGIVHELVGHGVGHQLHEDPDIPNHGKAGTGMRLKAGMTIAIEPMATLGKRQVVIDPDGWTVRTRDGSVAAHAEHTILITEDGSEILTVLR